MNTIDTSPSKVDEQKSRVGDYFDQSKEWQGTLYDDQTLRFNRLVARRKRYALEMLRELPLAKGIPVLDAPCGCGEYSGELMQMGFDVFGMDFSPRMIETCRERLGVDKEVFDTHFRQADIEHIPFPDQSFDLVVCVGMLTFLLNDEAALDELRRIVKPGGYVLVSARNLLSLSNIDTLVRRKLLSLFRAPTKSSDEPVVITIQVPPEKGSSVTSYQSRFHHAGKLGQSMAQRNFNLVADRTLGYEYRFIRNYHLLPESLLHASELFFERLGQRWRLPFFSTLGETYLAVYKKAA